MRDTGALNYYDTLHATGARANDAITEVYEDLQENLSSIAGVSSDRRSTLAKHIDALYDVCKMFPTVSRPSMTPIAVSAVGWNLMGHG